MRRLMRGATYVSVASVVIGLGGVAAPATATEGKSGQDATVSISNPAAANTLDTYFNQVDSLWEKGSQARPAVQRKLATQATAAATNEETNEVLDLRSTFTEEGLKILDSQTEQQPLKVEATPTTVDAVLSVTTSWDVQDLATDEVSDSSAETYRHVTLERDSDKAPWKITKDELLPDDYGQSEDAQNEQVGENPVDEPSTDDPADESSTSSGGNDHTGAEPSGGPTAVERASASKPQGKLNRTKVAQKALQWSKKEGQMSPNFPIYNNNCANLASQALRAGGWKYRQGTNRFNLTNWAPNLIGPAGPSRTWTQASSLYTFSRNTAKESKLSSIWKGKKGDLLFADWDPKGKADGSIDHVMIVTGKTSKGNPTISQQSPARHNIALSTSIKYAKQQGKKSIKWHGLVMD